MPEVTLQFENRHLNTLDGLADIWNCSREEAVRRLLDTHGQRMQIVGEHPAITELNRLQRRITELERQQSRLIRGEYEEDGPLDDLLEEPTDGEASADLTDTVSDREE